LKHQKLQLETSLLDYKQRFNDFEHTDVMKT